MTIVHPVDEVKAFRELSAFFRLLGIFVCEKLEGRDDSEETDYKLLVVDLGEDDTGKIVPVLDKMADLFGEMTIRVLKKVACIFEENELMRASYGIEYFSDARDAQIYEEMYNAHGRFLKAYDSFCQLNEDTDVRVSSLARKYVLAAQANCQRRMNQLFTILWDAIEKGWYKESTHASKEALWKKRYYSHDELMERIDEILAIDPEYYGAYAIQAFFEMLDDETKVDSMDSFVSAVELISGKSYSSYLRYRMGRYYEYILVRPQKSRFHYESAYRADPRNYRAIFKLSVFSHVDKDYAAVLADLDKIIDILECKKGSAALQPVECAYLFKAYQNKGRVYLAQNKYLECLDAMQEALNIYYSEENETENGFYPYMFKDLASVYKKAARRKLGVWKVYENMAEASARADCYEDYKKYSALADDNR